MYRLQHSLHSAVDYASVTSMIRCRLVVTYLFHGRLVKSGVFMIQYIREFALKNTVSVRLGLGSFLSYLRIGIGVGGYS